MLSTIIGPARRIVAIRRSRLRALLGTALFSAGLGLPSMLLAQASSTPVAPIASPDRISPKRETLKTAAENFEKCARTDKSADKRADCLRHARDIRKRLDEGDFQAGHRVLLFVVGDSALSDTFTVRSDRKLQLPNLPEMSLAGVLDSELQGYLETQLAQYIRNPSVRAQALMRVSVSGDVANPGFYSIRTDTPVSDVIMNAGGPSTTADINKTELRRGSAVVVPRGGIQSAIRSELTMSDIGARPGDELYVPAKPSASRWTRVAAVSATVMGIVWSVVYIAGQR
jgi:protein involved in polysaccharide export with SLBB domain